MNITASVRGQTTSEASRAQTVDMKLEVVVIPVAEIDSAKEFYGRLGWRLDADFSHGDERVIQFTPPGSPCSVVFGTSQSSVPGSAQNSFLIVSDIQAAREDLIRRGVEVGEVFHYAAGPAPFGGQVSGPAPGRMSYGSYATFKDPDNNGWLLQEVTTRFPGRVDSNATSFASASDLASAMRRASVAHGEHERRTDGLRHENWPDWYAEYMVAEQAGRELPT